MAHVSVTISGRQYRMACDDGQEHHLARLSHELDQRIAQLRTTFGEIGDMRLTVMAALLLADELAEARQRMRRVEEDCSACSTSASPRPVGRTRCSPTSPPQSMRQPSASSG